MKSLLLVFVLINSVLMAQLPGKEAWHWVFGQSGLDFSSGAPVYFQGSTAYMKAGCASISHRVTGQYLFCTDGVSVGNSNLNSMNNGFGLMGNAWTTQTLIVPHPGNDKWYYIISADVAGGNKGVHYSMVDMTQQNGLGKVTIKNKKLAPAPMTEKLTAVRHCNGIDYWIITHMYNSDTFKVFLVNANGIDTVPVISKIGTPHVYHPPYIDETIGYMKVSPNGAKLALGINSDSIPIMEMFDLNNATGLITNPLTFTFTGASGPYGLSFSPDNTKLYACAYPGDSISNIYQFDISSGIPSVITASKTLLGQKKWNSASGPQTGVVGAMQIAPDGKIYVARNYLDTLAVINNPNAAGTSCNFQWNGFIMGPPSWHFAMNGLPNFIDANYAGIQINIPDVQQCNTFTATTLDAGAGFTNYNWNTGASTQTISINAPGKYWITVTNQQGCTRTDTVNAYLLDPMKLDTVACDTFRADVTQNGVLHYNWFDSLHLPVRNFIQSGNYYVDINFVSGCAVRDSMNITIGASPKVDLGPDTSFCRGNLALNASCSTCAYQWNTGDNSAVIFAKAVGTYWVKVVDANGCTDSDTLIVKPQLTGLDFVMPNIVTPNGDNINDEIDFGRYQFSTFSIQIFNRWGQKVFSSEDPDTVWRPAGDEGTYFYAGQYRIDCGIDSKIKDIKGFITLER